MQYDENIRNEIENLLRQRIGLNPESVGSRSILRAVKKGMRLGKMKGLADYWIGLQESPEQFESLVESVVVPETSFFRNRASFVFLRQWIAQEWKPAQVAKRDVGRPLRVLSLPCSTGEEPFSIAITLLEEGLSLDDFEIDAVDISTMALEKARQGIYSPYAFRRQTYRSDDKYFVLGVPEGVSQGKRVTQRYFLADSVRDKVSFRQGNVLDAQLLSDQAPYDIIFCRNLLIYFDREARDRTFVKLNQLLRSEGLLFLGYAETSMVDLQQYQPVPYPQTFAYRKQGTLDSAQRLAPKIQSSFAFESNLRPVYSSVLEDEKNTVLNSTESAELTGIEPLKSVNREVDLQMAQQLADRGDIQQAIALCDHYLKACPSSSVAHLLRGELHQTMGDDVAAEACFEKSIYLDPHQKSALMHLMFLKEQKRDFAGALVIRERLQRLEK